MIGSHTQVQVFITKNPPTGVGFDFYENINNGTFLNSLSWWRVIGLVAVVVYPSLHVSLCSLHRIPCYCLLGKDIVGSSCMWDMWSSSMVLNWWLHRG